MRVRGSGDEDVGRFIEFPGPRILDRNWDSMVSAHSSGRERTNGINDSLLRSYLRVLKISPVVRSTQCKP